MTAARAARRTRRSARPLPPTTCRAVVDDLLDYLERTLSPSAHGAVDAHLSRCDACVRYVRGYEAVLRLARDAFD